jgi:hypothetical protein
MVREASRRNIHRSTRDRESRSSVDGRSLAVKSYFVFPMRLIALSVLFVTGHRRLVLPDRTYTNGRDRESLYRQSARV